MLVKVLGFGTNWWACFGDDADDPHRFTRRAAYYNSTGVRCGGNFRRDGITLRIGPVQRRGRLQSQSHRTRHRTYLSSALM